MCRTLKIKCPEKLFDYKIIYLRVYCLLTAFCGRAVCCVLYDVPHSKKKIQRKLRLLLQNITSTLLEHCMCLVGKVRMYQFEEKTYFTLWSYFVSPNLEKKNTPYIFRHSGTMLLLVFSGWSCRRAPKLVLTHLGREIAEVGMRFDGACCRYRL